MQCNGWKLDESRVLPGGTEPGRVPSYKVTTLTFGCKQCLEEAELLSEDARRLQ